MVWSQVIESSFTGSSLLIRCHIRTMKPRLSWECEADCHTTMVIVYLCLLQLSSFHVACAAVMTVACEALLVGKRFLYSSQDWLEFVREPRKVVSRQIAMDLWDFEPFWWVVCCSCRTAVVYASSRWYSKETGRCNAFLFLCLDVVSVFWVFHLCLDGQHPSCKSSQKWNSSLSQPSRSNSQLHPHQEARSVVSLILFEKQFALLNP